MLDNCRQLLYAVDAYFLFPIYSMKRIFSSLISLAAVLPAFWFNVVPNAADYCVGTPETGYAAYSVQRPDREGVLQTLTFNTSAQTQLCNHVAANAR